MIRNYSLVIFLAVILFSSCRTMRDPGTFSENNALRFLGECDLPFNKLYQHTTTGGLSGIDYDKKNDVYYLISDDRSAINPARFYKAKIFVNSNGIDSVRLVGVDSLRQANGMVYPNSKQNPAHTPDPEAIRYDALRKRVIWTSEGERIVRKEGIVLEDPAITVASINGSYIDSFMLPSNMHMQATEKGPRQNGVFEGLTFAERYKKLYVSVEEPMYEDGPRAGLDDSSGLIRIIKYNAATGKPEAQYGYQIDPVAHPATPPGAFKINGVPDILFVGKNKLIVIERSFSTGIKPCTIRVYLADLNGAMNVASVKSLRDAGDWKPVPKKLLLNMETLGRYIDNIEGVSFGPRLPNGHQTLIFVSDNNFSAEEITQFFLFEIE